MTDVELDSNFLIEERADYIDEDTIKNNTIRTGEFFDIIHNALISPCIKLIVGPRGCGKTHLMRYAWVECKTMITHHYHSMFLLINILS